MRFWGDSWSAGSYQLSLNALIKFSCQNARVEGLGCAWGSWGDFKRAGARTQRPRGAPAFSGRRRLPPSDWTRRLSLFLLPGSSFARRWGGGTVRMRAAPGQLKKPRPEAGGAQRAERGGEGGGVASALGLPGRLQDGGGAASAAPCGGGGRLSQRGLGWGGAEGAKAGGHRRAPLGGHGHDGEADEGFRVAALLPAAAGAGRHPWGAAAETVSERGRAAGRALRRPRGGAGTLPRSQGRVAAGRVPTGAAPAGGWPLGPLCVASGCWKLCGEPGNCSRPGAGQEVQGCGVRFVALGRKGSLLFNVLLREKGRKIPSLT